MKDHLIFDFTDATTIADTDSVGAFVRANDGTLITKHTIGEATPAVLITQGLLLTSKLTGTVGNSYSFTVIDTTPGALSFTEVAGAIVVDLHNNVTSIAQIVALLAASAYADVTSTTAGSIATAAIQSFTGGTDLSYHQHLDVFSIMAASDGTAITHHHDAAGTTSLDVHVTNPLTINVDVNGIYNGSTNLQPANVGLIGSSRAAPGLANQTLQFTGAGVGSDAVATTNIVAQDVNAFGMMWNGTSWDRMAGDATNGLKVDISNATLSVTQGTSPWVVSGTVTANAGTGTFTVSDAAEANTAIANDKETLAVAGTAQVAVASAIANRKYLYVYNSDNTTVYLGAAGVTAANGFPLSPGSYMEFRAGTGISPYFVGQATKTPTIRHLELA